MYPFSPKDFPGSSAGKESACNAGDPSSIPVLGQSPRERDRLPTPVFLGFPGGSDGKESASIVGDLGLIPGSGRSPGEGKGCPLQYFGLENSMNCIVCGFTKSQTPLSNFHFTSCMYPLLVRFFSHAGHYRALSRVPCAVYTGSLLLIVTCCLENPMDGRPARLQSTGSQRVGHD